jgi:hypothetical protein
MTPADNLNAHLLMLEEKVSDLPPDMQREVRDAVAELRVLLSTHGKAGQIALALLVAEFAAES